MTLKRNVTGHQLQSLITALPDNCDDILETDLLVACALAINIDKEQVEKVNHCLETKFTSKEKVKMGKITVPKNFFSIPLKEKLELTYVSLKQRISDVEQKTDLNTRIEVFRKYERLKTFDDYLLMIYAYSLFENHGKAESIIIDLLAREFWILQRYLFESSQQESEYHESLEDLVDKIDDVILNKRLWITLKSWVTQQFTLDGKYGLNSPVSPDLLKKMLMSPNYGQRFPGVWFIPLTTQYVEKVYIDFLERSELFFNLENDKTQGLWILEYYFPVEQNRRDLIVKKWKLFSKSKDLYLQKVAIDILSNSQFQNYLKKEKIKHIPLFKLKRQYYFDLLSQGKYIDYALMGLLEMGATEKELLSYINAI